MNVRAIFALLISMLVTGCAKPGLNPVLMKAEELKPADTIVVLGYGPPVKEDGSPAPEVRRRVEKAVELYKQNLAPYMIMTGGNTYKDYYESEVMKNIAVEMGVPADNVIEERQAMDTIGNARYSAGIMQENGWKSCIVVSTPYHLRRAKKLFSAAGLEVQTAGAEVPKNPMYGAALTLYEMVVRVQYLLVDEEELVRGEGGDRHQEKIKKGVRVKTSVAPDMKFMRRGRHERR